MRILINLIAVALIVGLSYLLYQSIAEPIIFRDAKKMRMEKVADRLKEVRSSQEIYRTITGRFSDNFDTLAMVLKTDSIPFQQIFGDPEDPDNPEKFIYKTVYTSALDSMNALGINVDSLRYVPYAAPGTVFNIDADTMTYQQTVVSVVEVGTRWKEFMGPYADKKFAKYDSKYNPDGIMKFGSMSAPNTSGNWE